MEEKQSMAEVLQGINDTLKHLDGSLQEINISLGRIIKNQQVRTEREYQKERGFIIHA